MERITAKGRRRFSLSASEVVIEFQTNSSFDQTQAKIRRTQGIEDQKINSDSIHFENTGSTCPWNRSSESINIPRVDARFRGLKRYASVSLEKEISLVSLTSLFVQSDERQPRTESTPG